MRPMKAVDSRVTFAELQTWPDSPRGERYELYDGEVIVVPAPFARHQRVASHIDEILTEYERQTGGIAIMSPLDIVFSEYDVLQPDLVFFRHERRHLVADWEVTRDAPDLAVEVLSRGTERRDRGRKMQTFARFGVPEYWIVDPSKNTLEIYVLQDGDYRLSSMHGDREHVTSPTLPSLSFDTDRIFAE
jgi:Uma2 family endonuclease